MGTVLLYAVDLDEMRRWVGCGDAALVREGLSILREDEDADWEPEELALLERLLRRMVTDGQLYEGLPDEERYYLTQLLIDLFDEMVESEAVSDEMPLEALETALAPLRSAGGVGAPLAGWLTRGRFLGSEQSVWDGQTDLEEILPFFGTVTREELPALISALESAAPSPIRPVRGERRGGGKGETRLLADVRTAARAALETGRDLFAFVA